MKAITKATLAVILTVGAAAPIIYSHSAPATEPAATTTTHVDTAKKPEGADTSKFVAPLIKTGVGEEIQKMSPTEDIMKFTAVKDADTLLKQYPFMTDVKGYLKEDAESVDPGVTVRPAGLAIAESKSKDGKSDLLFVSFGGGNTLCSDQGCLVTAYANDGTGYKSVGHFISSIDVRVDRANNAVVVTAPTASAATNWTLNTKDMKLEEGESTPQQVLYEPAGTGTATPAPEKAPEKVPEKAPGPVKAPAPGKM